MAKISDEEKKKNTANFNAWRQQNSMLSPNTIQFGVQKEEEPTTGLAAALQQAQRQAQAQKQAQAQQVIANAVRNYIAQQPKTPAQESSLNKTYSANDMAKGFNHAFYSGTNQAGYAAKSLLNFAGQLVDRIDGDYSLDAHSEKQKQLAQDYLERDQWLDERYGTPTTTLGRYADNVVSSAIGMSPLVAPYLIPGVGQVAGAAGTFLSSAGMGQGNALMEGASPDDAFNYALGSGALEAGTNLMFGGIPLQKGLIKAGEKVASKVGSEALKPVVEKGIDVLGEGVEEGIVSFADPYLQRATYNPNAENSTVKEILWDAGVGVGTAALMQGAANLPRAVKNAPEKLPTAQKVQQKDQNRAFEALHGQKMEQKNADASQNAENALGQEIVDTAIKNTLNGNKASQNQSSQADFVKNTIENVMNQKPVQNAPKISLEMSERNFDNVADKNVKAYQQENPEIKPFQQETAEKLLFDLQNGEKGRREVGIDAETRNVTTMHGINRNQSEPINRMLNDGLTYNKIEDGLNRIIEDNGKENTTNAKRVELYVHDAMAKGYNSIVDGRVDTNRNYAISKMSLEELDAESDRLGAELSTTTDEFKLEEISAQLDNIQKRMDLLRKDISPKLDRPTTSKMETVAENATVHPEAKQHQDYDVAQMSEEVRDFYEMSKEAGKKYGFNIRVVKGIENGAEGRFDGQGNILLDGNQMIDEATISRVIGHEVYHYLKGTDEHKYIIDLAIKNSGKTKEQLVQEKINDYYVRSKGGITLDVNASLDEIGAEFMQEILSDPQVAERIWDDNPTLAERIMRFFEDMIARFKGQKMSDVNRKALEAYQRGLRNMKHQQQGQGETRYMFAGELSRTADIEALARARQMEASGADMESIRQETGWFKSKVTGGEWAYEISDKGIEFSRNAPRFPVDFEAQEIRKQMVKALTEEQDFEKYKQLQNQLNELPTDTTPRRDILMDWMSHPELYEAYPHLRNMPFKLDETINANGEFDGNTIRVNSSLDKMYTKDGIPIHMAIDDTTQTMLHEVQHAVQRIEGFPRGSSPAYWEGNKIPTKETLQKIADAEKKIADVEAKFRKEWPNDEINLNLVKRYDELDKIYFSGKPVNEDRLLAEMAQIEEAAEMSGFDDLLTEYLEAQAELSLAEKYPDYLMPFDAYQNTAGEIMARDTANRRFMDSEQRKQKQPVMGDENTVYADGWSSYSLDSDMSDKRSIIEKLQENTEVINNHGIVSRVYGRFAGEKDTKQIRKEAKTMFDELNNGVYRKGFGRVTLNKKGIKDSLSHGTGELKNIAFEAIPDVIRDGVEIDFQSNWKGKGYDTRIFAGTILVDGELLQMGVVVRSGDDYNKYYLHEVYIGGKKNKASSTKPGSGSTGDQLYPRGTNLSLDSIIPENSQKVNDGVRYSLPSDKEYLDAVNRGDMETAQRMVDEAAVKAGARHTPSGKPIYFYHGTGADFTVFDEYATVKHGRKLGAGFYLTAKKDLAERYSSGKLMKNYVMTENYAKSGDMNITKDQVRAFISKMESLRHDWYTSDIFDLYNYKEEDIDYAEKLANKYDGWPDTSILVDLSKRFAEYNDEDTSYDFSDIAYEIFGYKGLLSSGELVLWDNRLIKSADAVTYDDNGNVIPLSMRFDGNNKDIRYSIKDKVDEYGAIPKGENPNGTNRDIDVPQQTADDNRVSRFARTAVESSNVDDTSVSMVMADMENGRFTYEPSANKEQIAKANSILNRTGWEAQYEAFRHKYRSGQAMTADDIVMGERLIQEAQRHGNYKEAVNLIADVAAIGTELGKAVQALSVLKRLSPQDKVQAIKRVEERINADLLKRGVKGSAVSKIQSGNIKPDHYKYDEIKSEIASQQDLFDDEIVQVKIPDELLEEMLQAESAQMQSDIWDECIQEMANQVPATLVDKINAWRYLAMLSNPKTHIRNMTGNIVMSGVSAVKRSIQTRLENRLLKADEERYAALNRNVPREYFDFAEWSFENDGKHRVNAGGGRYNDAIGQIEQNKRIFNNDMLETARKTNTELLEQEDMMFKKKTYIDTLARYMHANGLSPNALQGTANNASYEKGVEFATREAFRATFQEASKVANLLSQMENSSPAAKVIMGALVPFKKTPINILKRGVEYSPVGLMNGLYKMRHDVQTGKMTKAEAIDAISAGLTGTGIMVLGYFMASMGMITAGAGEDDERKQWYDQQMGSQNFALVLPNGATATIDWLAPSVMPLMAGAELYKQMVSENPENANSSAVTNTLEAISKVANPVLEMSMLQGVTGALQSYNSGTTGVLSDLLTSTATSYGGQFIPAPVGALARTIDDTVRSSYAPKDSDFTKTGEKFVRQQVNKVPVASMANEASIDVWGNERKREGDTVVSRAIHNFLNPSTYSSDKRTALDRELESLYEQTGDSGVLPKMADNYLKVDGKTYHKTAEEKTRYDKTKGQKSQKYVSAFVNSKSYKTMSSTEKAEVIADLYSLANYEAKKEMLSKRGIWKKENEDAKYEKVLTSKISPAVYYELENAMSDITGDGQKAKRISYLERQKKAGVITDEQYWYMRMTKAGTPSKADIKDCPYAWIKAMYQ